MKSTVVVRSFVRSDLPSILRIERESFDRDAWPRDAFLDYTSVAPNLILVARVGGRVAGYILACLVRDGAEIASLAVRPRYRQEGVATVLLKTMIRKLRRSHVRTIWLTVRRQNDDAIRLYRKLGFVRTGTIRNYYEDRAAGWRMRIKLDDNGNPIH